MARQWSPIRTTHVPLRRCFELERRMVRGTFSKAHISRTSAFGLGQGVRQSTSMTAGAFFRSRQILKPRMQIRAHLGCNGAESPALGKISTVRQSQAALSRSRVNSASSASLFDPSASLRGASKRRFCKNLLTKFGTWLVSLPAHGGPAVAGCSSWLRVEPISSANDGSDLAVYQTEDGWSLTVQFWISSSRRIFQRHPEGGR